MLPIAFTPKKSSAPQDQRGPEYERIRTAFGNKIMEKVFDLYPQLKGRVDHAEFQTPLSHVDHLGKHEGGIYGLSPDMARFDDPEFISSIRWKTDIPGLYLSGQQATMGPGYKVYIGTS